MLRLHYVPGGHGSPVCPKRSAPWDFGHFFLSFHVLLSFLTVYHGIRDGSWGYGLLSPGGSKARYGSARGLPRMPVRSLPVRHVLIGSLTFLTF